MEDFEEFLDIKDNGESQFDVLKYSMYVENKKESINSENVGQFFQPLPDIAAKTNYIKSISVIVRMSPGEPLL